VGLAHRDRELALPAAVKVAEAGVAVALRIALDVFVPEERQRDVLALELPLDVRPVGLGLPPVAVPRPGLREQPRLERGIGHLVGQWPAQPGGLEASDGRADRRRGHADPTGDLTVRYTANELQPKHFAHMAHGHSLCWHPVPPSESRRSGPESASRGTGPRARSSRNGGRHHLGMAGGIMLEQRAASPRNQQSSLRSISFSAKKFLRGVSSNATPSAPPRAAAESR
jgi:hypothetical protein